MLARWSSPDSLVPEPTNPQGFDRYSYVNQNPTRYLDPSGHEPSNGALGFLRCTINPIWQRAKTAAGLGPLLDDFIDQQPIDIPFIGKRLPFSNVAEAVGMELAGKERAVLRGTALDEIRHDPAIAANEKGLVTIAKRDPRYGSENCSLNPAQTVASLQLGGKRTEGSMWDQAQDPFNPKYQATWEAASNELTWLIRSAPVYADVHALKDGGISISYTLVDVLHLRPQEGRDPAYNPITSILGTAYHDILGGTEMQIQVSWRAYYSATGKR